MGGGCVTFVKEGVPYAVVGKGREEEYAVCGESLSYKEATAHSKLL